MFLVSIKYVIPPGRQKRIFFFSFFNPVGKHLVTKLNLERSSIKENKASSLCVGFVVCF